jgi:hypothetical protein
MFFPSLSVNNKTIIFVVPDLCEHEVPASKRGALKSYEITEQELIQSVEESELDDEE